CLLPPATALPVDVGVVVAVPVAVPCAVVVVVGVAVVVVVGVAVEVGVDVAAVPVDVTFVVADGSAGAVSAPVLAATGSVPVGVAVALVVVAPAGVVPGVDAGGVFSTTQAAAPRMIPETAAGRRAFLSFMGARVPWARALCNPRGCVGHCVSIRKGG